MSTAKTAWRCSQCGAVNEPGSRACAQCGKWPSLFDLQNSVEDAELYGLGDEQFETQTYEPESYAPETFEPESIEPAPFEPAPLEPGPFEQEPFEAEPDDEPEQARWKSILSGVIVPLALLLYFLISLLSDR
jgi:hypothetical protein